MHPTPRFSNSYLSLTKDARDGSEALSLKKNLKSVIPTAISEVTAEDMGSGHRGSTFTSSMLLPGKPKNESFCSNQDPDWWKPDHPYHQAHYGSAKKKEIRPFPASSSTAGPQTYLMSSKEQFAQKPRIKGFFDSQSCWDKRADRQAAEKLQSAKLFFKRGSVKKCRTQSYNSKQPPQPCAPIEALKQGALAAKLRLDNMPVNSLTQAFAFNPKLDFHRRNFSSNIALSSERGPSRVPSASTQRPDFNSSTLEARLPDLRQLIEFNRQEACEPHNSLPRGQLLTSKILQKLSQSRRDTKSSESLNRFLQNNRLIDEKRAVALVKHRLVDPQLNDVARRALLKMKTSESCSSQQ